MHDIETTAHSDDFDKQDTVTWVEYQIPFQPSLIWSFQRRLIRLPGASGAMVLTLLLALCQNSQVEDPQAVAMSRDFSNC
jgi:hypothetical protein